jgi:hypothetical protein
MAKASVRPAVKISQNRSKQKVLKRQKRKIAALKAEMLRLNALSVTLKDHAKKEQEIAFQKKRLDEFPVFGLTLPQVEERVGDFGKRKSRLEPLS